LHKLNDNGQVWSTGQQVLTTELTSLDTGTNKNWEQYDDQALTCV
jgi:hypothetical protein